MEFRILGPLEVLDGGTPVRLAGRNQRALLALLLLNAGEVVLGRSYTFKRGEEVPADHEAVLDAPGCFRPADEN